MVDYDKKIWETLIKSNVSIRNSHSLIDKIIKTDISVNENGGAVYDALITDAAGTGIAADIAAIDAYLVAGGDIHDVLYADAIGASLAVDIASIIAVTECDEVSGNFSYLDAGGEQTILEQTITTRREIKNIWLDSTNLTQDGTWILYHKINAGNYPEFDRGEFVVADDSDGLLIPGMTVNNDWKITWTEGADEGAARTIPYTVIYQELE
jgi:hypothetical protein